MCQYFAQLYNLFKNDWYATWHQSSLVFLYHLIDQL